MRMRVEDDRLVRGRGRFVDDLAQPKQAFGFFVRSLVAHGALSKLDTSRAEAAPGVLATLLQVPGGRSQERCRRVKRPPFAGRAELVRCNCCETVSRLRESRRRPLAASLRRARNADARAIVFGLAFAKRAAAMGAHGSARIVTTNCKAQARRLRKCNHVALSVSQLCG
jgi:xanthine dehydrogenase molybdopterin-binding subunit B